MLIRWTAGILCTSALVLAAAGCGQKEKDQALEPAPKKTEDHKKAAAKKLEDHSGWWCQEHGIPEHLCSLCSEEVAAKCKKEGDWCPIHDRAKSQCFKCDPSKYKTFEDMYVAKFNTKPEPPPKDEFTK